MVEIGRQHDRRGKDGAGQTTAPRLVAPGFGQIVLKTGFEHREYKVTNNLGPFGLFR